MRWHCGNLPLPAPFSSRLLWWQNLLQSNPCIGDCRVCRSTFNPSHPIHLATQYGEWCRQTLNLPSIFCWVWGSLCHQKPWALTSILTWNFFFQQAVGWSLSSVPSIGTSMCKCIIWSCTGSVQETSGLCCIWCNQRARNRIHLWSDSLWSWTSVLRMVGAMEGLEQRKKWFFYVDSERKKEGVRDDSTVFGLRRCKNRKILNWAGEVGGSSITS